MKKELSALFWKFKNLPGTLGRKGVSLYCMASTVSILFLTSCTTIIPINPTPPEHVPQPELIGNHATLNWLPMPIETVESCQPTLQWASSEAVSCSYDLIVYVGVTNADGIWRPGKIACYHEGIPTTVLPRAIQRTVWTNGTSMTVWRDGVSVTGENNDLIISSWKIDQPLLPNTVYLWSVRSRRGSRTSAWFTRYPTLPSEPKRNYTLWPFKTPER
jgi:hypothetical protein